jgi:putative tryptophan/tyrosine transport system substrate-binding protein
VPRIGVLGPRSHADGARYVDAFRRGLRELGWIEGKNVVIEYRWADGRAERLPDLAAELVRLKVDVIFAGATSVTLAVRSATDTIPIVMATGGDPVELRLVASLARPGGNVTGLAYSVGSDTFGKQLELLKEVVPKVRRVAVLYNPTNPAQALAMKEVTARARSLGLQLQLLEARGPNEFDGAFSAMAKERVGALLVVADAFFGFHRERLRDLAAKNRLPAIYGLREHTEAGGLMSYSVDILDSFGRAASYVDKILKGAKPADLPVEQPTKFELVINIKTAKALGLTITPSLLVRADRTIE